MVVQEIKKGQVWECVDATNNPHLKFKNRYIIKSFDYLKERVHFAVDDDEDYWVDDSYFTKKFKLIKEPNETPQYYDNSKGSIYQFCNEQGLNSYEFDIIKRIVRCRKKGLFVEDLQKTKNLIDLYLKEFNHEK